jgi:hypothetical protein
VAATGPITASSGASQATITVTVRDGFNNPISGANVTWSATGTGNTVTNTTGTTDGGGVFNTGRLSSTVAASKVISAIVNPGPGQVAITQTATVVVDAATPRAANSSVTAGTATVAACATSCVAGTTASTITVTARDTFNNVVPSAPVTLASTGSNNTFVPASGSTNGSGVFTTNFNSTLAQAKTISATASAIAITQTAAVTVNAATAALIQITAGNSQTARVGTAIAADPSVTVTDAFGNLAGGRNVTFTVTGGGGTTSPVSPAVVVTSASGVATLTSWTLGGTSADAANGTMANTLSAAVSPCNPGTCSVNFNASAIYLWSLDVLSLFNASSPYACQTCHNDGVSTVVFTRSPNTIVGVAATTLTACDGQTRVVAGSAATSVLYLKVDSVTTNQCGSKMPFTASFFSGAELKRLRAWINNGALNN